MILFSLMWLSQEKCNVITLFITRHKSIEDNTIIGMEKTDISLFNVVYRFLLN